MTIPNVLTLFRLLAIPVFVLMYLLPVEWRYLAGAVVFALASITDWLDGYLARRLQQQTRFGAFLDPVADKLLVVSALVLLAAEHANLWLTLPACVIVGREIVVSALREWMSEMHSRGTVQVSYIGKLKTTAQMVALILLLALPPAFTLPLVWLGYVALYIAAFLTLWSMVLYLRAAWPTLSPGLGSGADTSQ